MGVEYGDYREYKKEYRSRGYRRYKLFQNNFISILKNKWGIGVIIISFLFTFLNVMGFALGGFQLEETSDVSIFDDLDIVFRFYPADGEDLLREADLGENVTFHFILENTGGISADVYFEVKPPNDSWNYVISVEGDEWHVTSGGTLKGSLIVTVPDNLSSFRALPEDQDQPGDKRDKPISDPDRDADPFMEGYKDEEPFYRSPIEKYSFFRSIMLTPIISPEISVMEKMPISMEGFPLSSVVYIVKLSDDEIIQSPDASGEMNREEIDSSFSISIIDWDVTDVREMEVRDREEYTIRVENTGSHPIKIALYIPSLQGNTPGWIHEFQDADNFLFGCEIFWVDPGMRRDITLDIEAEESFPFRVDNLIIIGTDLENPSHHSNLTMTGILVSGFRGGDIANEVFYEMTGGLNILNYLWIILLSAVAGAGLIANDLKNNTLSLYLSRPISKIDYIVGKAGALFCLLSLITIIPAIVLFTAGMTLTSVSVSFIFNHMWILGSMLLSLIITLILFTTISLAFSSMTKRGIFAGAGIFSFFIFTPIVANILHEIFENRYMDLISIHGNLRVVFRFLFDLHYDENEIGFDWYYPTAVIITLFVVACLLIYYRMKKVET